MKVLPICSDTITTADPHIWIPKDFDAFIKELNHIVDACGDNLVFRGHASSNWLLESTLVRSCKKAFLGLEPHIRPAVAIRDSPEYLQAIFAVLLLKYDILVRPSKELNARERSENIDPLFETIKHNQQYPAEDECPLKGTFFLDWTLDQNVGLYFANFEANGTGTKERRNDGALFLCEVSATGKSLQTRKVKEIIDLMVEATQEGKAFGCPLIFHPQKQTPMKRALRQKAVYWAQMDLRYDLEYIGTLQEEQQGLSDRIYLKLVLPYAARQKTEDYLLGRGITHSYLFPD